MSLILLNSEFETARCAQYSWNILEDVGKSTEYSWDILEYVERALGYSWSFKAWVEQALEYSWNISAWIKKQLGYSWNIFATAITSGTFVKYEFSSAKRPKAFYINILNKVIGLKAPIICYCRRALSYSWDIPGIEKALSYSWNLLNIEKALSYSWVISDCCEDVSIGYTTQQMRVSEAQLLNVTNPIYGCIYNWEIISGGGSLSAGAGTSVIYTAPSFNGNCEQNPVIKLSSGENDCDFLNIAVNSYTEDFSAYIIHWECQIPCGSASGCGFDCNTPTCFSCGHNTYTCDDVLFYTTLAHAGENMTEEACPSFYVQYCGHSQYITDLRSAYEKEYGCCPAGLL